MEPPPALTWTVDMRPADPQCDSLTETTRKPYMPQVEYNASVFIPLS